MSDQVLSDEQRHRYCDDCDKDGFLIGTGWDSPRRKCNHHEVIEIERAVVDGLAQRSGVDVEGQLQAGCPIYRATRNADHVAKCGECQRHLGIIRLALATAEARHAEREAMWRELTAYGSYGFCPEPCRHNYCLSIHELRRALGLEG